MAGKVLPEAPGVYLLKDKPGRIIYVGKARNLKNRLKSYFKPARAENPRIQLLISEIADFEYIITDSEIEALLLESSLIKKHKPKFNIIFKDDKQYPLVELTLGEEFPRLKIARKPVNPASRYFGPYPEAKKLKDLLKLTRKLFPLRSCGTTEFRKAGQSSRACLNYALKLCPAPCLKAISREDYRELVKGLCDFLEGKTEKTINFLKREIEKESGRLNYESCQLLSRKLNHIYRLLAEQKVVFTRKFSADYLALAEVPGLAEVLVLKVREGKLLAGDSFSLDHLELSSPEEKLLGFFKQYYQKGISIPQFIFLPLTLPEQELLAEYLTHLAGSQVEIKIPQRGTHKKLLELAQKNAFNRLGEIKLVPKVDLNNLKILLYLKNIPHRIEAYDLSNLSGALTSGAMAVFKAGLPAKTEYRKFKIKTLIEGIPDDYAGLSEVLKRRFKHSWEKPDLLLIDGGKGQLGVAVSVLNELGIKDIDLLAIAKKENLIFHPEKNQPLRLPEHSPELLFLLRARDEAHRFAITYHKNLRKKALGKSVLDQIPGVGKAIRSRLLKHFGTLLNLRKAGKAKIAKVKGVNLKLAETIEESLKKEFSA